MYLTGLGDEAGASIDVQIRATKELGWKDIEARAVEVPGFPAGNIHDIPDRAFDILVDKVNEAGVRVSGFASAIGNWGKRIDEPGESSLAEARRAIPRMQRLGTKYIRVMSFKPGDEDFRIPAEVFRRVRDVTNMFLDSGLQPVHENCMNYGGMSWQHALELLDKCPGLKWVFDTANPIFNPDRSKPKPWPKQDSWEFWEHIRDHVLHIHVKDATWNATKKDADYNWPGEGQGKVREILTDAFARGYDAGISIEPHMVVVFHDAQSKTSNEEAMSKNYVEYGRVLETMIEEIKIELKRSQKSQLPAPA